MVRDPRRLSPDDPRHEQFGLSANDRAEIHGRAIGGHIFDSLENTMGGPGSFRASYVADAWANAHKHWQGHDVRADEDDDDYPVVHLPGERGWHGRYPVGGQYVDMYHGGSGPHDVIHVDKEDRTNPAYIKSRISEFSKETDPDWYR